MTVENWATLIMSFTALIGAVWAIIKARTTLPAEVDKLRADTATQYSAMAREAAERVLKINDRCDALEEQGDKDRQTIAALDSQAAKDRARIAELEAQSKKDSARIAELEAQSRLDGGKIAVLETQQATNVKTIDDLRTQLAAKDREIVELQEAVKIRDTRISDMECELVVLRTQLEALGHKPKRKTGELPSLEGKP